MAGFASINGCDIGAATPLDGPGRGEGSDRPLSLFLTTERSAWGTVAAAVAAEYGMAVEHVAWHHGDPRPGELTAGWSGDWIVGFKADYVFSAAELAKARLGAVNFHPGPPAFRGVGGYEQAVAAGWKRYGVTCHYMDARIDHGPIIKTLSFSVEDGGSVTALRESAAAHLYLMFVDVLRTMAAGTRPSTSGDTWSGPLHTWSDADASTVAHGVTGTAGAAGTTGLPDGQAFDTEPQGV